MFSQKKEEYMKNKLQYMLRTEQFLEVSFIRQFALAFILMSLAPIMLLIYVIYGFGLHSLVEQHVPLFSITITFIVLLSLAGYDLIRRNMVALYVFVKQAQELLEKRLNQKIDVQSTGDIKKAIKLFNELIEKDSPHSA
jgi:methyl-accepting chemotaxis protein